MIKLERNFHPLCITPAEVKRLTDEFKQTKASVWNFAALKTALLSTSNGKCAYCECDLTKESNYMEVEHFRDKDSYPDDVVCWDNLLPSCKRCNVSKGTHDVVAEPIINPYEIDPKHHFQFRLYRFRATTSLGKDSLGVLDLNNSSRAVVVRFEIGEKIHESLEHALEILDTYEKNGATRTKNRLLGTVGALLLECQPSAEYSATAASVVHSSLHYETLVGKMQKQGLWTTELDGLHVQSKGVALD